MSKNTKEIAAANIKEKLESLNKEKGLNLEFIGFKEENWKGSKEAIVVIKCNIHNRIIETKYKQVVYKNNKDIIICSECLKERVGNSKHKFSSEDDAKVSILNKINSLKPKRSLKFLGFVGKFRGASSFINIKCNIHNEIRCIKLKDFLKSKDGGCRHCAGDATIHQNMLSNKQIFERLVSKFGDYYDFSPILGEKELGGKNGKRLITFICPKHGIKTQQLSVLMNKITNNIPCGECALEFYREQDKEKCIKDIQKAINWRNKTYGLNYEFIGFDREYINKNKLYALIRCITHNTIFKVKPRLFIEGHTITKCEYCDLNRHKYEDFCYRTLISIGLNVIRQHPVKCYDDNLNKYRTLNVDFYLSDLNIIIEYDGCQHYMFNTRFHKTIEDYKDQVRRDIIKNQYCKDNNIPLLRITYRDNKRIEEIITTFIKTGENIAMKLIPREYPEDDI